MYVTPDTDHSQPRYLLKVLLIALLAMSVLGTFDTGQYYVYQDLEGKPVPWSKLIRSYLPFWWTAALLMPAVAWLARRLGFPQGRRIRIVAIHAVSAIAYAHVHIGATQLVYAVMWKEKFLWEKFVSGTASHMTRTIELDMMIYTIAVVAVLLVEANRGYRAQERERARLAVEKANLQASLADARLDALRMQLQPHFLFNALHAISTLIMRGDNQAAHRMLLALSDFLRMTLDSGDTQEVALDVELEFLEAYLQIQRERFGDRLQVEIEIDPAARTAQLPALMLQPLVENSIRHGVSKVDGKGLIEIDATMAAEQLVITVKDNGPGIGAEPQAEGVGLANIRARLQQLYPDDHAFTLDRAPEGGAVATLRLPLRRQQTDANRGETS